MNYIQIIIAHALFSYVQFRNIHIDCDRNGSHQSKLPQFGLCLQGKRNGNKN